MNVKNRFSSLPASPDFCEMGFRNGLKWDERKETDHDGGYGDEERKNLYDG